MEEQQFLWKQINNTLVNKFADLNSLSLHFLNFYRQQFKFQNKNVIN